MKGEDNPAWIIHNTNEYLSKEYYKKRMASTNPDEPLHRRCRSGKTYSRISYTVRKGIKKED